MVSKSDHFFTYVPPRFHARMKSKKLVGSLCGRPEGVVSDKENATWEGGAALEGERGDFLSMEVRGGSAGGRPRGRG